MSKTYEVVELTIKPINGWQVIEKSPEGSRVICPIWVQEDADRIAGLLNADEHMKASAASQMAVKKRLRGLDEDCGNCGVHNNNGEWETDGTCSSCAGENYGHNTEIGDGFWCENYERTRTTNTDVGVMVNIPIEHVKHGRGYVIQANQDKHRKIFSIDTGKQHDVITTDLKRVANPVWLEKDAWK